VDNRRHGAAGVVGGRFGERLAAAAARAGSLVCVGLDPDPALLPAPLRGEADPARAIVRFNAAIIEATADLVCAFKPNLGFYLAFGAGGIRALEETRRLIPSAVPAILDAKTGDIDSTAAAYAAGIFDALGFDAVTVNPYLGEEALAPFLGRADRGVFVLAKTSNRGGGEFQDLLAVEPGADPFDPEGGPIPLHLKVAERAAAWADRWPATVGLVVGATYPAELAAVRGRCPELPILLPGVGAQAGDVAAAVGAGLDRRGGGLVVASSRAILYAGDGPDFAERARAAALRLRGEVEAVRGRGPAERVG